MITDMAANNEKPPLPPNFTGESIYSISLDTNSNQNDIVLPIASKEPVPPLKDEENIEKKNVSFVIKITNRFEICINKALLPLKLAQFCWFGGGSFMGAFLTVFLKQRGVSLSQLSWLNVIAPIVQLIGTTLTGVIADKIGRSKPVLIANLLLVMCMIIGILVLPTLNVPCERKKINFICLDYNIDPSLANTTCDFSGDTIKLRNCNNHCLGNATHDFGESYSIASMKLTRENFSIFPDFIYVNQTFKFGNNCYYDITTLSSEMIPINWCKEIESSKCQIDCLGEAVSSCNTKTDSLSALFIIYSILYVLYLSTFSNVYRCFDVTSMALTKDHNGDFGRERFFAISGNLMISPLAGLLADVTTVEGGERNYAAALYLFLGMSCLVLVLLYKLPVQVNSPGQKMWKKSFQLLKNPDIVSLAIVVLVLGTAWNFTKIFVFWYLSDLHSPSVLIGLIPSISALYGLPLLITASWWVEKVGCRHIFIFAFLGYVLKCIGYSFLVNPWLSLLLESFGALTYYLLWVAVIIYSHELAPEGLRATVVAVAGAIHYSVGKATGGLVGGLVMDSFGGRVAFRLIAVICLVAAVLYGIYLSVRNTFLSMKLQLRTLEKQVSKEETKSTYSHQH